MDLTIPGGMGGKEAIKKLKIFDKDARVIVSIGYSNNPIMPEYESYGFVSVIGKPFRIEEFSDLIHTHTNN
jgi:DNA-binding NtrC family response regulator